MALKSQKTKILRLFAAGFPIIPSLQKEEQMPILLESRAKVVLVSSGSIFNIEECVQKLHQAEKIVFAHIDLIEGLGKDAAAVSFLKKKAEVDGIVSPNRLLIAAAQKEGLITVCIFEGQNLQDCGYVINYDIHWNPVRIIQRFGRIDRIGSRNARIRLVNFWPDLTLDDYIKLKSRVETWMKISVMTSTGDDNLINADENGDLEYRKAQLQRLHEEVVDIEEMSTGISIMDLGLNEFRLDLLDYIKNNGDLDKTPFGLHAVVPAKEDAPAGVIFVLKNLNGGVNIDNQNRLHPFCMVYIADDGQIICDHLSPKEILDKMRYLCKGKTEPASKLCRAFNIEADDGINMRRLPELLSEAINSVIKVKEESDIDSLFRSGGTSALNSPISDLDDFELICFLVIR